MSSSSAGVDRARALGGPALVMPTATLTMDHEALLGGLCAVVAALSLHRRTRALLRDATPPKRSPGETAAAWAVVVLALAIALPWLAVSDAAGPRVSPPCRGLRAAGDLRRDRAPRPARPRAARDRRAARALAAAPRIVRRRDRRRDRPRDAARPHRRPDRHPPRARHRDARARRPRPRRRHGDRPRAPHRVHGRVVRERRRQPRGPSGSRAATAGG